jgi:hypothetical protein
VSVVFAAGRWVYGEIADDPAGVLTLLLLAAGICLMIMPHLPLHRFRSLSSMLEPGERLLKEARQPQTIATSAQIEEFMERGDVWDKKVAAIFIANDDRERLDKWTRIPLWYRGRPQPRNQDEADLYLAQPISERLRMLEDFCRESSRSDAPQ